MNNLLGMSAALREEQHLLGRKHLMSGDYFSALAVFQSALVKYGPHVGLLSDIIASFYLLGRVEDCALATQRLQVEWNKCKEFLSEPSFVQTSIFLGKMLEEQAEVAAALDYYEEAAHKAQNHLDLKIKAQCQSLRLRSYLGIKTDLCDLYRICLKYTAIDQDLNIELEHALMLAELCLFGQVSAMTRLKSLLARTLLSADVRLVAIDFAEYLLNMKTTSPDLAEILLDLPFEEMDEFEKIIFEFAVNAAKNISVAEINRVAKLLPTLGLLKVFGLGSQHLQDSETRLELKKRFVFIANGLSSKSQALLQQKWQTETVVQNLTLNISLKNSTLSLNGRTLTLKADSFGFRCLSSFVQKRTVTIENFVLGVFDSEYNLSYHDRTRIALQRLNKDLAPFTGQAKTFSIQKGVVILNDTLEIQISE